MPTITLRHFAIIRETVGAETETRTVPDGTTAADIAAAMSANYPRIAGLLRTSPVMVNAAYADLDAPLEEGDEIAFIPPVAGGAEENTHFAVTDAPLVGDVIAALVAKSEAGAVVTFIGTVRNHARGRAVLWLDYEAYAAGCTPIFAQIAAEMRERWSVLDVAIHHRVGHLLVGEASVVIAVSSAHRHDAFAASEYAIDRLKERAPIWKKEAYADGEIWIGAEAAYQSLPDRRPS
jgi:molybdopterin synthase catalytic subunit/molybdopterin converting factor small subunit